jgi:hypothetical protein
VSFGERIKAAAKELPAIGKGMLPFVAPAVGEAIPAIAKMVPGASQVGFAAGAAAKALQDQSTIMSLEDTAAGVPTIDVPSLTQKYYGALRPGLLAKGWTDAHIMQEARDRATNAAYGAQATKDSIDQQVQQTRSDINAIPGEAVSNAVFMGVTPKVLGALGSGLLKATGQEALAASVKPATTALGRIGASVVRHAAGGASIGAIGIGAGRATDKALEAWAADKPSHEIVQELVKGGFEGGKQGLEFGAALGGTLGPGLEGAAHLAGKIAAAPAERAAAIARDLADKSAAQVAERDAHIAQTANTFDPHRVGVPLGVDPVQAAISIVEEAHGPDAINAAAGRNAIEQISNRIKLYQDANEALQGNIEPQHMGPSQGVLSGVQPVGAPLQPEGGLAPGGNEPPAVQGPVSLSGTQFSPPESVPQMEGLAAPSLTATKASDPFATLALNQPEPQNAFDPNAPRPTLLQPGALASPGQAAASAPTEPVRPLEPNPRTLEPTGPVTPAPNAMKIARETNPAAQHIVSQYMKAAGHVENPGREMHPTVDVARAQEIANQYHAMENAKPGTPEFEKAKQSYDALNKEIAAQYKSIKDAGFKFTFTTEDPYPNSSAMRRDVRENHHLSVFEATDNHHPFMSKKQTEIFRAVHDFFGHAAEGFEFGPRGEEAAFRQHAATLSNEAIPALASETRGQNSWVNFFPENVGLSPAERPFAEQKFNLLPKSAYEDVFHGTNTPPEPVKGKPVAEKLVSPARDFGKQGVVTGESHAAAQEAAFAKFGQETPAEQGTRGYVTDKGRFVTAAEGDKLAEAAGQVNAGATKSQQGTYSSQDLSLPKAEPAAAPSPAPEAPAAPAETVPASRPADAAAAALADETHGAVAASADGQTLHMQIGVKPGEVAKPGGPQKAIDRIVKTADEHGVSVETDLVPAAGPKGGKIPLEKLIPWYEARGFKVVESTKIPEGNLATAKLVREPIGQHQNDVASAMEKASADAQQRINAKSGRLSTGFDPTLIGDHALQLAADMFSKRLRGRDEIASWAAEKWGSAVKPFIDELVTRAQKAFVRMFKETGSADKSLSDLLALHDSGKYGMGWYEKTADWAKQKFGKDSDMFLRFLAVTSANGQTESGAAMALKAFAQWKSGMDFEGFRGESMVGQLKKSAAGEPLAENSKIKNFLDALRGDPNAVVLDRWMLDALNMKEKGGTLKPNQYKVYDHVIKQLAEANDMTPRQFQAAVWEGARVRSIQTKEAMGGRALATKTGSARPLEELVDRKLGGMSVDEYVKAAGGDLSKMDNLYKALKPVRTGIDQGPNGEWTAKPDAPNGHSFDPNTFEPVKHEGHVVPLVSNVTDRGRLYPARLLRFRNDVEPLLKELEAKGLKPSIGVWQEQVDGKPTGKFSLDLNVMVKDQKRALDLGKLSRQHEIAQLGKGGDWKQNIATGYDPEVNGKQFLPPKDFRARQAWFKQQMNRARAFLKKTEPVGNPLANEKGTIEITKPGPSSDKILKSMTEMGGKIIPERDLTTQKTVSGLGMDSIWIGPDGDIVRLPMTHARHAKLVNKAAGLHAVRGYEGSAHGAGSDVQALLNAGFIRTQASGHMIAFDLSQPITDSQRGIMKRALGAHEDWAAAISDSKGKLVKGMSSSMGDRAHHFLAAATEHDGK